MIDNLYFVLGRHNNTCKRSIWIEMRTLRYLNKYLFREREYNNISKEICSENIYAVENEDYEFLFWRSHGVLITHKSCPFIKMKNWNVISHL
jgi:hypothetical protein